MAKGKKNEEVIVEAPVVEEVITVKVDGMDAEYRSEQIIELKICQSGSECYDCEVCGMRSEFTTCQNCYNTKI